MRGSELIYAENAGVILYIAIAIPRGLKASTIVSTCSLPWIPNSTTESLKTLSKVSAQTAGIVIILSFSRRVNFSIGRCYIRNKLFNILPLFLLSIIQLRSRIS